MSKPKNDTPATENQNKIATGGAPAPTAAPVRDDGEDLVTVELFKDNVKYKDPLPVCVNGESILIERGVRVKIKRKFLWAIQNQIRQDKSTAKMISAEADAFRAAQKAHGDA